MVIVIFLTLVMGIVEFGRAWMVANMITHAARDGARIAAVVPSVNRDSSGLILNTTGIEAQVVSDVQGVLDAATVAGLTVSVTQPTVAGVTVVQVTVTGNIPYVFNLFGSNFAVNRVVTFKDEGR